MADLKTKIIVVAGPTASGKTSLGIEIAKAVDGEIISADSMQVYQGMSIAIDKEAALKIHKNNKSRVARAIEIYYTAGKTKTMQNEDSRKEESPFETLYLVLAYKNREILYDRINRRVDMMIKSGLVPEAERVLAESGSKTSAQAIGHKELKPYLDGEITLDTAVDNLKKETRHYAKRQITWFKRRENAVMIYMDGDENPVLSAVNKCREFIYGK